jgi:hypothetical protein
MMKVIVVFKRLLASGNDQHAIYSNGGNRWNILGFNFTKREALSSVYKISMVKTFLTPPIYKGKTSFAPPPPSPLIMTTP